MKVIAVIPCLNESKYIAGVVGETKKYCDAVLVSDDSSTDDTMEQAKRAGAFVVGGWWKDTYRGAGSNTDYGLQIARRYYPEAEVFVTLDGDGQHKSDEIPLIIAPILSGEADLVIGRRVDNEHLMPRYRKFGIAVITWFYNVGGRQKIVDGQSCFRAFHRRVLEAITITEKGFGFSTEVLVKVRAAGLRITEVPISCFYHKDFKPNSSMNPIRHGLGVLFVTLKWRIKTRC